jgi:hypothetical protein
MKKVRLDRTESRRYQEDPGATAELLAEQNYQGYSRSLAENFDLANENGSVLECKSAQSELANGEDGRFRLFKSQHERLTRKDRNGSAFYVFVLFDVEERPITARMKRMNPADIGRSIGSRGGWYNAGHVAGKEYKLPIEAVFNR